MHTWHEGERVTIREGDTLVKGTIRKVLAGRAPTTDESEVA